MLHKKLTGQAIQAFYKVYNKLGYGFLEKVYEKALLIELEKKGLNCASQHRINVYYDKNQVGKYYADIFVEEKVILELKASKSICKEDEYQLINYLKATNAEVGLLLNFGKKPEFKRKVYSNKNKNL